MSTRIFIVPNVRTRSSLIVESNNTSFLCPTNTVLTGRWHQGDENGSTRYEYATLKVVDEIGIELSGVITVEDVQWSSGISESAGSGFEAPANRVLVGRSNIVLNKI